MKNYLLILVLICVGCSTGSNKSGSKDDVAKDINLTNADFQKKPVLSYQVATDKYVTTAAQKSGLTSETMNNSPKNVMDDLSKPNDLLSVMMVSCYKKDFKKAFEIAEMIFSSHQNLPSYWNQLASCQLLQGNDRKALLFYNKALEVKPNYVPALNNIGVIYYKNSQEQKAQVAFEKAFNSGKFSKTPRYNLAFLYLNYGLGDKSLTLFKGLQSESPNDPEINIGLANSLSILERWPEAYNAFLSVPDDLRKRSDVGLNMAVAAFKVGKGDLAKQVFGSTNIDSKNKDYAQTVKKLIGD